MMPHYYSDNGETHWGLVGRQGRRLGATRVRSTVALRRRDVRCVDSANGVAVGSRSNQRASTFDPMERT